MPERVQSVPMIGVSNTAPRSCFRRGRGFQRKGIDMAERPTEPLRSWFRGPLGPDDADYITLNPILDRIDARDAAKDARIAELEEDIIRIERVSDGRADRVAELEEALKFIAHNKHTAYESNEGGDYGHGITDGHRYCSNVASAALKGEPNPYIKESPDA